MKKLNFHALYLLSFLFFDTSFCFSLTNNRLVKTVRQHKKKIIAGALFSMLFAKIYYTNKQFDDCYNIFISENDKKSPLTVVKDEFANYATSLFLSSSNKKRFLELIKKYKPLNWIINTDKITNEETYVLKN